MPLALVFTSAPRGLAPGRSGYVTVARHAAMPARLAEILESVGTPHEAPGSATFTLRSVEAGGRRWRVLSRLTAGGLDHTRRDNRLAHHLAFAEDELAALPPPADVARRWAGWLDGWTGEPAWLEEKPLELRPGQPLIPCSAWRESTGSGAKAAWLTAGGGGAPRSLSGDMPAEGWLRLLAEAGALVGPGAWDTPFTTDAGVTGSAGFAWRCQRAGGEIDLAAAAALPAPEGPEARRAAVGVGPSSAPRLSSPRPADAPEAAPGTGLGLPALLGIGAGAALLAFGGWLALRPRPTPAPPAQAAAPAPRAPTAAELEAARNLLRDQAALGEINDCLGREDVAQAARLWLELERLAPAFAQRNAEPTLARIRSRLCSATARAAAAELERPGAAADPRRAAEIAAQAAEGLRLAEAVGAPRDAARSGLEEIRERARLVASLDMRPTLIVPGRWVTASAGAAVPASADFDLGAEAGAEVRRFLGEGLGGPGASARGGIRLVAFRHLAHRDPANPRPAQATIEPGVSSVYIGEAVAGGARPAVAVTAGTRTNAVSLNLPGPPGPEFLSACQGIELVNAAGKRLCLVLVPEQARLEPLALPLAALAEDAVTKSLAPAAWIEPAFAGVRVAGARPGLFPAGHAFPDRAIPSLVSPPSRLDTTLLRLAAEPSAGISRAEVAERQRQAREGSAPRAGAPWTIRAVNLSGEATMLLAEFRD